jgi:hypothetical protein
VLTISIPLFRLSFAISSFKSAGAPTGKLIDV